MKSFEEKIFGRVKKLKKKIVFVDSLDERLLKNISASIFKILNFVWEG